MKPLLVLALALLLFPAGLRAAGPSLGRAIPEDYFLYLRRQANPERRFLSPLLADLHRAAAEARLAELLVNTLVESLPPAGKKQEAAQWRRVLEGVDWGRLLSREYALGARFQIEWESLASLEASPSLDWIALFRVDPAERDSHLSALRRVVLALATREEEVDPQTRRRPGLEVLDTERDGVPLTILSTLRGETRLCLGGSGEVVAAASSALEMRRALKLLAGEGSGQGLAGGQELEKRLAGLPAPKDGELLFRPGLFFSQLRSAARVAAQARVLPQFSESKEALVRILEGVVGVFDLVESVAVSETTEGRRLLGSLRVELEPEARKCALYGPLVDRPPLGDFRRLVPRDCDGFAVTSGVDLEKLEDAVLLFMEKVLPEGPDLLEELRRFEERKGFEVKRDLLGLLEGRAVVLSFPPLPEKGPAQGGSSSGGGKPPGAWVALFKLKDAARAEARLEEWLGKAEALKAIGMEPQRVEIPELSGSWRAIRLPLPSGMEITFGVSGGELAAGTSPERIRQAFLVRSGKAESIEGQAEWTRLGLSPRGDLHSIAYQRVPVLSARVSMGLGALFLAAELIPDAEEGKRPLSKRLLLLAPKLSGLAGAALRPFDQAGGYLVRDGNGFRGEVAVTVRPEAEGPAEDKANPSSKDRRKF